MSQKYIWIVTVAVVLLLLASGLWLPGLFQNTSVDETDIISRAGIHWHPQIDIYVHGEKQKIPANIGLVGHHNPMHTHDDTGEIHLEYPNLVRQKDVTVGSFFNTWGKKFSCTQLFEHISGPEEKVTMTVSGEQNTECENYVMRDGDHIEVRFEKAAE